MSTKRFSCPLLLLSLLACTHAFAALTAVQGQTISGSPPGTCTIGGTVGPGQAIVVVTSAGTITSITDSVNSGDYTIIASYSGEGRIWLMIANASGTPVISLNGTTSYMYVSCAAITGFVGTPTVDTSFSPSTATGTGTVQSLNVTSNFNNEALLILQNNSANYTTNLTVSGWTGMGVISTSQVGWYSIEATAGTANNWSATMNASYTWYVLVAGIYDPGASASPNPLIGPGGHPLIGPGGHPLITEIGRPLTPLAWIIDRRNRVAREERGERPPVRGA